MAQGLILWCDSDVRVAASASSFRAAGYEVRCLHEPEELLEEYRDSVKDVVAVVSSMMESKGRKERGAMNAFALFAEWRELCYEAAAAAPVFAIISSSADRSACFRAGSDVICIGNRSKLQQLVLNKLDGRSRACSRDLILWCDSGDPSGMGPSFRAPSRNTELETFSDPESMASRVEELVACFDSTGKEDRITAVISSMMESNGRKEAGLMNAYDCFARIREALEEKHCRPLFAVISGSGKMRACYEAGTDIAITKDNATRKARHPTGNMWSHVAKDVISMLAASSSVAEECEEFPSFWKSPAAGLTNFSEMVPITDGETNSALQLVLRNTFKRRSDGTAHATRDRPAGERPTDFRLAQAYRIEDASLWRKYAAFRAAVGPCEPFASCAGAGGPPKTAGIEGLPELSEKVNEAYLFHGTSPEAANGIIHTGFRIDLAGTAAGCAFGKGAYLAESSTKSDEYARAGDGIFGQMYAMLLCRVTLARTVRVEEFYHSSHEVKTLVDGIISDGTHDCLLGDREAAVGTYREFIVFKREQIYPEFVLLYHRDC